MDGNGNLIEKFYKSFQALDAEGMKSCYHPEIQFSDPVFPKLKGQEVGAMWEMLIKNLKKSQNPWRLEFNNAKLDGQNGSCHWEAFYTLSTTGRSVHNIIEAKFRFKDNLIIEHQDSFDFYRWAKMGFGATGVLIGWTPFFRNKVQTKVKYQLSQFLKTKQT